MKRKRKPKAGAGGVELPRTQGQRLHWRLYNLEKSSNRASKAGVTITLVVIAVLALIALSAIANIVANISEATPLGFICTLLIILLCLVIAFNMLMDLVDIREQIVVFGDSILEVDEEPVEPGKPVKVHYRLEQPLRATAARLTAVRGEEAFSEEGKPLPQPEIIIAEQPGIEIAPGRPLILEGELTLPPDAGKPLHEADEGLWEFRIELNNVDYQGDKWMLKKPRTTYEAFHFRVKTSDAEASSP